MPLIRTKADLDATTLTRAEKQLIDACIAGKFCTLGDGTCPYATSDDRTIRADILRYLMLGGCPDCRVHERGVWLIGGFVSGTIDIDYASVRGAIQLQHCHFDGDFKCTQARIAAVDLSGSTLQRWIAQSAQIEGNILLQGVTAKGCVNLDNAMIGGQLDCVKAHFKAKEGNALSFHSAKIKGSVFLYHAAARQTVNLNNTVIEGGLYCSNATFAATTGNALSAYNTRIQSDVSFQNAVARKTVDLGNIVIAGRLDCSNAKFATTTETALCAQGARIEGDVFLHCTTFRSKLDLHSTVISSKIVLEKTTLNAMDGDALFAQSLHVKGGMIWRGVTVPNGTILLHSANLNVLSDDGIWPEGARLHIDGLTYTRVAGTSKNAKSRLRWLQNGSNFEGTFYPQPYTQLASVLRDMGQDSDARKILAARERLLRKAARKRLWERGKILALPVLAWMWLWDALLNLLVGYGFHPFRAIIALALLITAATIPANRAWTEGSMIATKSRPLVAETATANPQPPLDAFNRYAYAVDLVIPIITLGQTQVWVPSREGGPWGYRMWWMRWVFTASGWIVSALGAAAITGITNRRE